MSRRVVYSALANAQLNAIYLEVAGEGSDHTALRLVLDIMTRCERLAEFPLMGRRRDDISAGMRTFAFDRRVLIAYGVAPLQLRVAGIYRRGEDFEAALRGARRDD
ncbi:MAG TPA: type II toxin-antitoxin system RelE/ParE family toxin [Caulobacter sp.]|nr:type II toxin-antitoxin system RelE/ParE family toxin [Caulobacter sp.]